VNTTSITDFTSSNGESELPSSDVESEPLPSDGVRYEFSFSESSQTDGIESSSSFENVVGPSVSSNKRQLASDSPSSAELRGSQRARVISRDALEEANSDRPYSPVFGDDTDSVDAASETLSPFAEIGQGETSNGGSGPE
jgi:hypothetical protein